MHEGEAIEKGADGRARATCLRALPVSLTAGRCAQAMGHLLRALDTMSKHLGGEHLWTADVMHEIGSLHTAR